MYQPLYEVLCISRDINSKLEMDLIKRAASYNENNYVALLLLLLQLNPKSRRANTIHSGVFFQESLTMAKTEFLAW